MESQVAASSGISQLSRMNAFYGIPNLSQETAQAVQQGAVPPPEVYTPGENLRTTENQGPESDSPNNGQAANPIFQNSDSLSISDQAARLQQQAQQQSAAVTATVNETPPPAAGNDTRPAGETSAAGSANSTAGTSRTTENRPTTAANPNTTARAANQEQAAGTQTAAAAPQETAPVVTAANGNAYPGSPAPVTGGANSTLPGTIFDSMA